MVIFMQLTGFQLSIRYPEKTLAFYTETLGMRLCKTEDNDTHVVYTLCFENASQQLQLVHEKDKNLAPYALSPQDSYWKFSIFVDDIQQVYQRLMAQGHSVSEPYQFGDIGYLAHTLDSENHQIEFIQKSFQGKPIVNNNTPVLGLLTLRTADPMKSIRLFETVLDMKLLVRMHVERGSGFSLYFLGDKNLTPPSSDMDALENREWMYQQQHLFIELQHYWGSEHNPDFALQSTPDQGLQQMNVSGDLPTLSSRLAHHDVVFAEIAEHIEFTTIDKQKIVAVGE